MQRDLRLDFLRGTALLIILWDHIFRFTGESLPFFLEITPIHWGLSSAAEAFVFLSGYVYGVVYGAFFERHGFLATCAKSLSRAFQLYSASMVTMIVVLAIGTRWPATGGEGAAEAFALSPFLQPTNHLFWDLATLRVIPWGIEILGLYIALLISAPVYIALLRKHVAFPVLIALALYATVQLHVTIPFSRFGTAFWYFNPFAWQLLFLLGIVAATGQLALPKQRWLRVIAACVLCFVAIHVWLLPKVVMWPAVELLTGATAAGHLAALSQLSYPFDGVRNLEPVRLAYFGVLAFVTAALTNPAAQFWRGRMASPVVLLGQSSLPVYCFGVVFTYATVVLRPSLPTGWPVTVAVTLFGFLLSMLFAAGLHQRRHISALAAARRGSAAPIA
jgi:hypothetical protein